MNTLMVMVKEDVIDEPNSNLRQSILVFYFMLAQSAEDG